MLLLIGLLAAGFGPVFWALLKLGELVMVEAGLFVGTQFIPWSALSDFRKDGGDLVIDTPTLRGYWNYWQGTIRLSKHLFAVPDHLVDQVRSRMGTVHAM